MCADDDFLVPSAITKCVAFLENNKDYSSAQGHYVSCLIILLILFLTESIDNPTFLEISVNDILQFSCNRFNITQSFLSIPPIFILKRQDFI